MSRGGARYRPTQAVRDMIRQYIAENYDDMSYMEMAEELTRMTGREYSVSMICNYANRMGIRKKERKMRIVAEKKVKEYKQTLCWWCANAVPGRGCEWADRFEPVPGWDAEPTVLRLGSGFGSQGSFLVKSCGKFVEG